MSVTCNRRVTVLHVGQHVHITETTRKPEMKIMMLTVAVLIRIVIQHENSTLPEIHTNAEKVRTPNSLTIQLDVRDDGLVQHPLCMN